MSFSDTFRSMAVCKVNLGDTVMFWNDSWGLGVLSSLFPQLHSFAVKDNVSVKTFLSQTAHHNFHTPLSIIASEQLHDLAMQVQELEVNSDDTDCWTYRWGSPIYT